ncbi:pentatricopeptide repeat-containing protein At5g13270, chloroplastic [Euphorbia lathyris]|uniref:pentatricopeptide repeat-containing protein At5g13270, chloroplastic n=1 Tax=Euphorbia lathyris TaxID=212925 RepID=UPI0033138679
MEAQCSFAVQPFCSSSERPHAKIPSIKPSNFTKLPSWLSLKHTLKPQQQHRNGQIENLQLISLSKQGNLKDAIEFLQKMIDSGIDVDLNSYKTLFEKCGSSRSLSEGRLIHKQIKYPCGILENFVLKMYVECGSLVDAGKVFDEMSERNLTSWGTIISAYAEHGLLEKALCFFSDMIELGIKPNSAIYVEIFRVLIAPALLEMGKQMHSHVIRSGFGVNFDIATAIFNMYVKCGCLEEAEIVLNQMNEKNVVVWTGLMVAFTQAEKQEKALALFDKMVREGLDFDEYVFSITLKACAGSGDLNLGKQIHCCIVKLGLESQVSVGTPLVDFYTKCAEFESALKAFERIIEPNDVSWSALITSYCQMGEFEESLKVFESLRSKRTEALNSFAYTSIFQACSALSDFTTGSQVHADAVKRNLIAPRHGESAMVTMYSRCGKLDYANLAFESISEPDTVAWTAMIAGYAYQGNATEALKLFRTMQNSGVRPNEVTFTAVLTACSHSGLVEQGRDYLHQMSTKYGVAPSIDHYDCMIDIYARAGHFHEAIELIKNMPFDPDAMSWKCLLGGCWTHRNLELGVIAAENLLCIDPDDTAGYVLLFNLYAAFGKWKEAANIRKTMSERNLRKELSCSWITVKGEIHRFIVGDKHHSRTNEIYSKLNEFDCFAMNDETGLITEEDVSIERKEQLLVHSERLAIAFGLISLPKTAPVMVFKNLRACKDCHEFIKQVSFQTGREIVVRDSCRFHHFKLGECSCNDYW